MELKASQLIQISLLFSSEEISKCSLKYFSIIFPFLFIKLSSV